MSTLLEIVNKAVIKVGESTITQNEFDNKLTKVAKVMSEAYVQAKSHLLRSYNWMISSKYARLEAYTQTVAEIQATYGIDLTGKTSEEIAEARFLVTEGDPDVFYVILDYRFNRSFALPTDHINTLLVTDISNYLWSYMQTGKYIHSDCDAIYLQYTHDVLETDLDESIVDALAAYLAKETIIWLGDKEEKPRLDNEYLIAWRFAKSMDAQQNGSRSMEAVDWIGESRGGGLHNGRTPYPQLI